MASWQQCASLKKGRTELSIMRNTTEDPAGNSYAETKIKCQTRCSYIYCDAVHQKMLRIKLRE